MSAAPDLSKPYDPSLVEARWYDAWEKGGVFEASDDASDTRPTYVLLMPPPNVTGSLHMGHAQRCTIEDALVRYHRMRGFNTLWQPGMDHAGIATQTVLVRQLAREGKTRHDLGREKFIERVWQWKAENGDRIALQQRVLGASPDWRRSKFTMDPDMSRAVTEAFVRLYDEGLMYRATRLINWCPECRTALSDLEVEAEEGANGELFEFAYPLEDGTGEIVVATTRPETMLGDSAVAVHPDDPRYTHLHGKHVVHPFQGRLIPIVCDPILVDPKFGTGAVKVTPAHDFNDFATGKRHGLQEINILELDGTMNATCGPFAGMERKQARKSVKLALAEKGLARGTKPHTLTLPRCQRSGGVVEPMISTQWFLKMKTMADRALEAVHSGRVEIVPPEWVKTYDHFLENIQDWCVSRQLWWGHQLPAWHGPQGEIRVARVRPPECSEAGGWTQDPDVLDTWFSSALWPISTLGWPERTPALAKFYPTNPAQKSDLETGYDILFFWVARMIMFGLHFTDEVPFRRVLLSGLIVDETGAKMSKVKGNVIDPLDLVHGATFADMVKKTLPGAPEAEALGKFKKAYPSAASLGAGFPPFGADAVRFTLSTFPPSARRIALAPRRIEGYRHFLNKVWNATRLSLDLLADYKQSSASPPAPKHTINRWVLSKLGRAAAIAKGGMDTFRVDEAANELYRFFWYDFCDWYLELAKSMIRDGQADAVETRATLAHTLDASLRLLHPLVPFVTEELWQRLARSYVPEKSIALARYPMAEDNPIDLEAERAIGDLQALVTGPRAVRTEYRLSPAQPIEVRYKDEPRVRAAIETYGWAITTLVRTSAISLVAAPDGALGEGFSSNMATSEHGLTVTFGVGLKGLIDAEKERDRIRRELGRNEKELGAVERTLASPGFTARATPETVTQKRADARRLADERTRLQASLVLVSKL